MSFLSDILGKLSAVVDALIPVAHGDRTKIAALVAVAAPFVCSLTAPLGPSVCNIVKSVGDVATAMVPVFAGAGLFRK